MPEEIENQNTKFSLDKDQLPFKFAEFGEIDFKDNYADLDEKRVNAY